MPRAQKKSFNEGKLNTVKKITDFSSTETTFVVSEELVKIYLDNLKHLQLDLRNQATVEKRRNRDPIYYWQELLKTLLLSGVLKSLCF